MIIEILSRTPPWVFVLFFVLLALGYLQSKNRTLSRGKVLALPTAMIVLSFYGVFYAFGMTHMGLGSWILGVATALGLGLTLARPKGVAFSTETQSFSVPGSWFPLAIMMAIFFTKYAVGVIFARQLPMTHETGFIGSVSFCYGFLSGTLLARATVIFKTQPRQ